MSHGHRLSYEETGWIGREATRRATQVTPKLSGPEWQVLTSVWAFTLHHNKLEDAVSLDQLANLANLSRKWTRTNLERLAKRKLITYSPGKRGHRQKIAGDDWKSVLTVVGIPNEMGLDAYKQSHLQKGLDRHNQSHLPDTVKWDSEASKWDSEASKWDSVGTNSIHTEKTYRENLQRKEKERVVDFSKPENLKTENLKGAAMETLDDDLSVVASDFLDAGILVNPNPEEKPIQCPHGYPRVDEDPFGDEPYPQCRVCSSESVLTNH